MGRVHDGVIDVPGTYASWRLFQLGHTIDTHTCVAHMVAAAKQCGLISVCAGSRILQSRQITCLNVRNAFKNTKLQPAIVYACTVHGKNRERRRHSALTGGECGVTPA